MSHRQRRASTFLYVALGIATVTPLAVSLAHDDDGAKRTGIVKTRHDGYHKLGEAFKTVRDQTKAGSPDMGKIKSAAQVINDTSVAQFKWFPAGSGPESGQKTYAKPEIWTDSTTFESAQKLFGERAPKLLDAANGGDIGAVRTQFGEVGKACKNCHDKFRVPEEEHKK